jgi:hypothetical protein
MTMNHLVAIFYIKRKNNQKMMMSLGSLSSSSNITIRNFFLIGDDNKSTEKTEQILQCLLLVVAKMAMSEKQKYVFENGWCS